MTQLNSDSTQCADALDLPMTAAEILRAAERVMRDRAANRNVKPFAHGKPRYEDSMPCAIAMLEAYNGGEIHTAEDGYVFMALLKLARHRSGALVNVDDFLDGAAYLALAGEQAIKLR